MTTPPKYASLALHSIPLAKSGVSSGTFFSSTSISRPPPKAPSPAFLALAGRPCRSTSSLTQRSQSAAGYLGELRPLSPQAGHRLPSGDHFTFEPTSGRRSRSAHWLSRRLGATHPQRRSPADFSTGLPPHVDTPIISSGIETQ